MLAALLQQTPEGLTEARDLWVLVLQDASDENQIVLPVTSLATLSYALKDFDGCQKYYEQLLAHYRKIDEESSDVNVKGYIAGVLNNMAYLLADDLNRPEEALPYIEEAVRLARDTGAILDTQGWILILVGRYREGIGVLTRAIELEQDAAEYHLHAAEGYAREGTEMASAAREFNRARELAEAQGDEDMVALVDERARELKVDLNVKSND
jgi:tetratricopeptide (TPR) repeat protein